MQNHNKESINKTVKVFIGVDDNEIGKKGFNLFGPSFIAIDVNQHFLSYLKELSDALIRDNVSEKSMYLSFYTVITDNGIPEICVDTKPGMHINFQWFFRALTNSRNTCLVVKNIDSKIVFQIASKFKFGSIGIDIDVETIPCDVDELIDLTQKCKDGERLYMGDIAEKMEKDANKDIKKGHHYTINGDNEVIDNENGLIWRRRLESLDLNEGVQVLPFTYNGAIQHASSQSNGWRIPTKEEVLTLFNDKITSGLKDPVLFRHLSGHWVWIKPSLDDDDAHGRIISLRLRGVTYQYNKNDISGLLLVRNT